jgi:hypothetical protein
MHYLKRSQIGGVASALLLCAAWSAHAQDTATTNSSNTSGNASAPVLGPPALKDFQLEPRERLVTQPNPQPERPAAPPPQQQQPPPGQPQQPAPQSEARRPAPSPAQPTRTVEPAPQPGSGPIPPIVAEPEVGPTPSFETPMAPTPSVPMPAPQSEAESETSWWLYALPLAGLIVVGTALLRRRRRRIGEESEVETVVSSPAVASATPARPEPAPRPWLEVELKAQRASFTATEWVVQFELSVANTGAVPARNLKIDVMLFNAGKEQDKEIGAFFRTAGQQSTKLALPGLDPGRTGIIDGEVAMPLAEVKAMKLNNQTLFIPVAAVNALYQWGEEGNTGQTAKSYIVGRELQEPSEKMGAFRLDLGPRIWRTVGQRQHKLARRF